MCCRTVAPLLGSIFEGWGDTGLLSREAEVELGKIVQKGLQLQTRLDEEEEVRGHSLSPEEQEAALGLPADVIQVPLEIFGRCDSHHADLQLLPLSISKQGHAGASRDFCS